MEIVELIFVVIQMCGCFLDLAALGSTGTATYSGVQTYRQRKKDPADRSPTATLGVFLVFAMIAFALIVLVIMKYAAP
jgi:hypothetical protein